MSEMQILEELEFLMKVRDQKSIGVSYHDNISIYCKSFESNKSSKELKLKAEVEITMSKLTHEKEGRYFESLFYNTKVPDVIDKALINKFKEIVNDRIKELREKAREVLGIPEGKHKKEIGKDYIPEGGDTI